MSKHKQISFLKSGIRILGYLFLLSVSLPAALVLIISEIIGIWEEFGEQ